VDAEDAVALVLSLHLVRQHLTSAQRAFVALEVKGHYEAVARRRMRAGGGGAAGRRTLTTRRGPTIAGDGVHLIGPVLPRRTRAVLVEAPNVRAPSKVEAVAETG
jgi:hypothetical protein